MKHFLIFLLSFVLMSNGAFAQESKEESKSKTVEFMAGCGSLMKKEFYDLPKVKSVENQVLIITNVLTGKKVGCLRVETSYYNGHSSDSYIGTLDYEELDACVKSLTYIKDELLNSTPEVYTEAVYKTLDNLKLGAFYSNNKWTAFVYTKGYTSRSAEFLDSSNITTFIEVMNQAKAMITEKTK